MAGRTWPEYGWQNFGKILWLAEYVKYGKYGNVVVRVPLPA